MPCTTFPAFGWQRRQLLGGLLAWGGVQLLPWAASAPASPPAASAAFVALSAYLTERQDLNPRLAARLQAALVELDPAFGVRVETLWQWLQAQRVGLSDLDQRLKAEQPELADLPTQLMQSWYLGIASKGAHSRVVAYEYALNAQLVSDKLRPPTYAYGGYGSWSSNPTTFDLRRVPVHA